MKLDPTHVSIDSCAELLSKSSGKKIDSDMIQADISAGIPLNEDGTINLIHYTAWLVKESRNVTRSATT